MERPVDCNHGSGDSFVTGRQGHIRIGGLGPLSPPGISWAGRELINGMTLAVQRINKSGGVGGKTLELIFEDTKGSPAAGLDAVGRLASQGVQALAGEYHSVVANAVVVEVDRLGLPFVCSSATLDAITSRRLGCVFRICPPQSYGWRTYASYIAAAGVSHVIALMEDSLYWKEGAGVIESRLLESSIPFKRIDINSANGVAAAINHAGAEASKLPAGSLLLLLVGYPEYLSSVLHELRRMHLASSSVILGDPAGRTIFRDWWEVAGPDAVGIPFLAYEHPRRLTDRGEMVARDFETEFGREPSFVALEAYDSILALEAAIKAAGSIDPSDVCCALRHIEFQGTRGTIRFSTETEGVVHQQWKWAPTCVMSFRYAHQPFSRSDVLWDTELTA